MSGFHRADKTAWATIACGLIAGCSGSGEGLDQNGQPLPPAPQPVSAFKTIQDTIFTPMCVSCHAGATAPRGLRLEEGVSYAALVNTPSSEVPALLRVQPGNPDNSYLVHKIEGRAAVGQRMPLGAPPLSQDSINLIRQWIADGAVAPAASAGPVTLKTVFPAEEAVVQGGPAVVLLAADAELDTSLLTVANITVLRSGGDDSFAEGNEAPVTPLGVEVRSLEPTVFALSLPQGEWLPERYLVVVAGSGPAAVADRRAIPIDGDSDGRSGGDFEFSFVVTGTMGGQQ